MRFPLWTIIAWSCLGSAAGAVDLPGTALSLSGGATIVSDYRFRGVSQGSKHPALQAELSLTHASGLYGNAWASTIDLYDDDPAIGFKDGQDLEIDATAGWSGDISHGLTADIAVTYYTYPGVTGAVDYAEALASLEFKLGPVSTRVGGGYFPDQPALPDDGTWLYAEASGDLPGALTLTGHAGRQFFGPGFGPDADYWEWSLGLSRDFGPVSASLSYIDTDLPKGLNAGATVVASLGIGF
jgi:uncharacterized protein (TIGR02001 family)